MTLGALIEGMRIKGSTADMNAEIKGISYDSRRTGPGDLFFALRGGDFDGRDFIKDALERGASAVLCEEAPAAGKGVAAPCVYVDNGREAMAYVANAFYGRPSEKIKVIGVTGTNGKTTTAYIIKSVLDSTGSKTGLIGTVKYMIGSDSYPAPFTTPEAAEFQRLLSEMLAQGCDYAVSEVSSHALAQRRTDFTAFRVAVFTNLTRDHLDFHGSMEEYFSAKRRLFEELLAEGGAAVVNLDDPYGERLTSSLGERTVLTYGTDERAVVRADNVKLTWEGISMDITFADETHTVKSPLVGAPNVHNVLAASAACLALGISWRHIERGMAGMKGVEGRFEKVDLGQDFACVIDYAHTDDALRRLIQTARLLTSGRVIVLFGCGGQRDRGKRPLMGEAATSLADVAVITSDNPRREDPAGIISDIKAGVARKNYHIEPDRAKAIRLAMALAKPGDTVLIAGKGHENYQDSGGVRRHFSDREEAASTIDVKLEAIAYDSSCAIALSEIVEATKGSHIYGDNKCFTGVSIDSRTIGEGELFIALRGARFDGHDFIVDALNRGAGALVSVPPAAPPKGKTIVHVDNTLRALQAMARNRRLMRGVPVIGVTGTNGKTTTKEMTATVLSSTYHVMKNTGNLNNQIGLPLSLMRLAPRDDVAVLEMGASAPGDIRELCDIAGPGYAVLTNIGYAHLEGFRDIETVRDTKLEILDYAGTVIANADDAFLMDGISGRGRDVIGYSINGPADVHASDIEYGDRHTEFTLHLDGEETRVRLGVAGRFNVYNALAAASVGFLFGIPPEGISAALSGFAGVPMRLEIKEFRGAMVISDLYNANPGSMDEALRELARHKGKRTIAVLGDMLELGAYAETAHRRLGANLAGYGISVLVAVGPLMKTTSGEFSSRGGEAHAFETPEEAREFLRGICCEGDVILVKGSRGMRMERVIENGV